MERKNLCFHLIVLLALVVPKHRANRGRERGCSLGLGRARPSDE